MQFRLYHALNWGYLEHSRSISGQVAEHGPRLSINSSLVFPQLHKQHAQLELERHLWHRRESDESGESAQEEPEAQRGTPSSSIPRSASYPFASSRQAGDESAALQVGFQRRYGGVSGMH